MRKYLSLFKIRMSNGLQYRVAAYAGVATQFAWGFMLISMYAAFYRSNPAAFPMELSQVAPYVWLQLAFLALFMMWYLDNDILAAIMNGDIAYELARPMDLYNMWFAKNLAMRLSSAVLRCWPILVFTFFLPEPYRLTLPPDIGCFIAFISSMALAFFVVVAFCMLIYISVFYTLSATGSRLLAITLTEILTGAIIPLPFLPDAMQKLLALTPFAAMSNMPLRAYSGQLAGSELYTGIFLQIVWLVALVLFGRAWLLKALKKVIVQGG